MDELIKYEVGLAEVEEFQEDLSSKFRSQEFQEKYNAGEMKTNRLVKLAMEIKRGDERKYNEELNRERNMLRRKLEELYTKNSKPYRRIIKELRQEAAKIKRESSEKYEEKLKHLKEKYKMKNDEKLSQVPKGLDKFWSLSTFDRGKFDQVEKDSYEVEVIGDITLSDNERSVLSLHPKFSVISALQEGDIDFEQESAFAKLRMQLGKELDERLEDDTEGKFEMTSEERSKAEELEARTRQVFDPIEGVFDDRKRRVTDLQVCSRIKNAATSTSRRSNHRNEEEHSSQGIQEIQRSKL